MKLTVRIGKGDQLAPRGLETGTQGGSVTLVLGMAVEANMGAPGCLVGGDGSGSVLAAVINDEDLIIRTQTSEGFIGLGDGLAE
jgi:hypothetical protein